MQQIEKVRTLRQGGLDCINGALQALQERPPLPKEPIKPDLPSVMTISSEAMALAMPPA
jgi:hypothetical protein